MMQKTILISFSALLFFLIHPGDFDAVAGVEDRILVVVQEMETAFKRLEDYSCEVKQIFYQDGLENQYRFKFYFKKEKKIRVDFSQPHPGLTVIYHDHEVKATIIPYRSLSSFKIRLSVDNPIIKTPAGQRINQTDMGYFIDFLSKNLKKVHQKETNFIEDDQGIEFIFWAMDYIEERSLEKYRISISKKYWLPTSIERYSSEGKLLEVSDIKNYVINANLEDIFFLP